MQVLTAMEALGYFATNAAQLSPSPAHPEACQPADAYQVVADVAAVITDAVACECYTRSPVGFVVAGPDGLGVLWTTRRPGCFFRGIEFAGFANNVHVVGVTYEAKAWHEECPKNVQWLAEQGGWEL